MISGSIAIDIDSFIGGCNSEGRQRFLPRRVFANVLPVDIVVRSFRLGTPGTVLPGSDCRPSLGNRLRKEAVRSIANGSWVNPHSSGLALISLLPALQCG